MPFDDDSIELAPQLGDRVRNAVHGQRRGGERESAGQGIFRVGYILPYLRRLHVDIDLRNQRSELGTSGRAVRQMLQGVEKPGL